MSEETVLGVDANRKLEAAKDDFRNAARKLYSILSNAKGEPAANNTDAEVREFARALQAGEETDEKITAVYNSVSGGEEGAPLGALNAVSELIESAKRYQEVVGN